MRDDEPWNIYENQQSRFTFNSITNCLGQGQRQQPGQGGGVVMHDAPTNQKADVVDIHENQRNEIRLSDVGSCINQGGGRPGQGRNVVMHGAPVRTIVRRLTPLECERLMGWPDNYTAHGISDEGELVDIANTNRYRICGNGIVATVTEWIGHRLPKEQAA